MEIYNKGESLRFAKDYKVRGDVFIGGTVKMESDIKINVTEKLAFLGNALIRDNSRINGRILIFGDEVYLDHHAEIGGGSCYDEESMFLCGSYFHLGSYSMVNTARPVTIGNVVGLGRMSNVYTHGAYLDVTEGFPEQWGPVAIGNNVWMPNMGTIMPGVTVGDNTIIASGSFVNKDIEGGGLWAGTPAKRIEEITYPNPWTADKKISYMVNVGADKNKLRRHGIRG